MVLPPSGVSLVVRTQRAPICRNSHMIQTVSETFLCPSFKDRNEKQQTLITLSDFRGPYHRPHQNSVRRMTKTQAIATLEDVSGLTHPLSLSSEARVVHDLHSENKRGESGNGLYILYINYVFNTLSSST